MSSSWLLPTKGAAAAFDAASTTLGVRKNSVACSPVGNFNFRHKISPHFGATMASSMSFSARVIQSSPVSPMKRMEMTRSRSFRRSDLRRGASFLPPRDEEPDL